MLIRTEQDSGKKVQVNLIGHARSNVDISVLTANIQLSAPLPLELANSIILGQDVYFLGFPYSIGSDTGINRDYLIPFVKKGILSAMDSKSHIFYLDGHNNPGFSGGPVVCFGDYTPKSMRLLGVISAIRQISEKQLTIRINQLVTHQKILAS